MNDDLCLKKIGYFPCGAFIICDEKLNHKGVHSVSIAVTQEEEKLVSDSISLTIRKMVENQLRN